MHWVMFLDNALTNNKGAAILIRPEINNRVNLNTNSYFVFCFLIVNVDQMKIFECEIFSVSCLCWHKYLVILLLIAWLYL